MLSTSLVFVLQLVAYNVGSLDGFNFDVKSPVYKHGNNKMNSPNFEQEKNIYFGYSVAQHTVKSSQTH